MSTLAMPLHDADLTTLLPFSPSDEGIASLDTAG